jgi:hypothetical protein
MGITVKIDYQGIEPDNHVLKVLGLLIKVEVDFDFEKLRSHWFRRGYFTPRQMGLVAWRLKIYRIDHKPAEFRVSAEFPKHREALLAMEPWKRERLLPYLSVQQRKDLGL